MRARFLSYLEQRLLAKRNAEDQKAKEAQDSAQHARENRYAKSVSRATWIIAGAGILTFVAALLQWDTLGGQLGVMRAEQAAQRPWVTLDDAVKITKPLFFDQAGAHVGIVVTLRNGGRSVAQNAQPYGGQLVVQPVIPDNISVSYPKGLNVLFMAPLGGPFACDPNHIKAFVGAGGGLLLPGATQDWPFGIDVPRNKFVFDSGGLTEVWTAICVIYRDESGAPHATPVTVMFEPEHGASRFAPPAVGEPPGTFKVTAGGADPY